MRAVRGVDTDRWHLTVVALLCGALAVFNSASAQNVEWTGGGGTGAPAWSNPDNWVGDPPANPAPGSILYRSAGQDVNGVVVEDWIIGGINLNWHHTVDLANNMLTLGGTFTFNNSGSGVPGTFRVENGTLTLGTDTQAANIRADQWEGGGTLTIAPGAHVHTHNLGTIQLTEHRYSGVFGIDLRGANVVGGIFKAVTINFRGEYARARILLDDDTEIDAIHVTDSMWFCSQSSQSFIGYSDTNQKLPPNIDLLFGIDDENRAALRLGVSRKNATTGVGRLEATGPGVFTAWLSTLAVGGANAGNVPQEGVLDIAAMDTCFIDAETISIGTDRATSSAPSDTPRGTVKLPPDSTVETGTLEVGGMHGGFGLLEIEDTTFNVADSLTLNATADIRISVSNTSRGITVEGAFVDNGGTIHLNFIEGPSADIQWGLRIKGDVTATLAAMRGGNRLTWAYDDEDPAFDGKFVWYVYDETTGYSYVALVDDDTPQLPAAAARDLAFEREPGGTVVVDVSEINDGSFDPLGRPYTLTLSSGAQQGVEQLNLESYGAHAVTITITVDDNGDPLTATAECTVTVSPLHPGSTARLEWLGNASTDFMDRRDWFWKGNWLQDVPPTVMTTAIIDYGVYGSDVKGIVQPIARIFGTGAEPFAIAFGDVLTVSTNGGSVQQFVFSEQPAATAAAVAAFINDTAQGFEAIVTGGSIALASAAIPGSSLTMTATPNLAAELGMPEAETADADEWTIGGIVTSRNTHTIDLAGNRLTVGGTIGYSDWSAYGTLQVTNGTLRLGRDGASGRIRSTGWEVGGTLVVAPGAAIDTYNLDDITLQEHRWKHFNVDLRGANVVGGIFKAQTISFRGEYSPARIMLDDDTEIDAIHVTDSMWLSSYSSQSFIGYSDTNQKLPPNIDLLFGIDDENRAALRLGVSRKNATTGVGRLEATGPGAFTAWLSTLAVGGANAGNVPQEGVLDIAAMDTCFIDAARIHVGFDRPEDAAAGDAPRGTLRLPPGTVSTGDLLVGADIAEAGFGLLTMSNTMVTVTNTMTIANTGEVIVNVGETAAGIALTADASLERIDGVLRINFIAPRATTAETHYGLRWEGDHVETIQDWVDNESIVVDATGADEVYSVFMYRGATYLGIPLIPLGTLMLLR